MAAPGQAEHVNHTFCEAVTGAIFHGFCALPIARGTSLVNAPTISGFAWRGHSLEAEASLMKRALRPRIRAGVTWQQMTWNYRDSALNLLV